MRMLNNGEWNKEELTSNFGAFLIDHINQFKEVDYKHDSSDQIEVLFRELMKNKALFSDFTKT